MPFRSARSLAIMLASGVSLVDALVITSKVAGNVVGRDAFIKVREDISQGVSFGKAMDKTHLFPSMYTSMIKIGEASGSIDGMLNDVADYYQEELNTCIRNLVNEKDFTLVELIVVIAILAILAAVAVPNYANYQYRSAVNTDIATALEIVRATRMRLIENPGASISHASDLDEFTGNENLASDPKKTVDDLGISISGDVITVDTDAIKAGSYTASDDVVENQPLPKPTK